ncbi:MAG: HAD family phosphatase [Cyclobacteriaceae bacterium]
MQTTIIPVPTGVKGLIFDLDGTLLDSMPMHHDSYNYALEPWGVFYPLEEFYSRAGMPNKVTMSLIEKDYNIENFDLSTALQRRRDFVDNNLDKIKIIEPVYDIMKEFHGKVPMAIGTGSSRKTVNELMSLFPVFEFSDVIVTATEVTNGKPHPETFLKCAEMIGVEPKDCVVYEDGIFGIESAIAAGMEVVDVTKYL